MIGRLRGTIASLSEDSALIDCAGVGYEVFIHPRLRALLKEGEAATFCIETHVREDHFHLYAFANAEEREWCRMLTSVQGVGMKMGQTLLGAFTPEEMAAAIAAEDMTQFTRVSGVGPKLAGRLVSELKSKVAKMGLAFTAPALAKGKAKAKAGAAPTNTNEDAISALTNLGYSRTEAFSAVMKVQARSKDAPLNELIRLGLKELAA